MLTDAVITIKEISEELEIQPVFPEKHHWEKMWPSVYEGCNEAQASLEESFKRDVFYPIVDTIIVLMYQHSSKLMSNK